MHNVEIKGLRGFSRRSVGVTTKGFPPPGGLAARYLDARIELLKFVLYGEERSQSGCYDGWRESANERLRGMRGRLCRSGCGTAGVQPAGLSELVRHVAGGHVDRHGSPWRCSSLGQYRTASGRGSAPDGCGCV